MEKRNQRLTMSINDINIPGQNVNTIRIVFGPHQFLNIKKENNRISFEIGATHHGVKFDASDVDGELYQAIEKLRELYPSNKTD